VHPFRHNGWSLAHNGVVTWNGAETPERKAATCDSQHLLYCLTEHPANEEAQRHAFCEMSGYAAFLALGPGGKLIAAVDDTASLYAGITKTGRWIFGTTPQIVEAIADAWGSTGVNAYRMESWSWLTFARGAGNPRVSTWHHAGPTHRELAFSQKSLGFKTVTQSAAAATTTPPDDMQSRYYADRDAQNYWYGREKDAGPLTQHNLDDNNDWGVPSYNPRGGF
jgi:hypothetical protein